MHKTQVLIFAVALLMLTAVSPSSRVFGQSTEMSDEKRELYTKYYEKRKGNEQDQKVAYELGQEFVRKFGADDDAYVKGVRKFIEKYEELDRGVQFNQALTAKDYPKAFSLGQQILTHQPDNFAVRLQLVQAAYINSKGGNSSLNAQGMTYAKQALELLDAKKVTDPAGMPSLEDARGYLYFASGWFLHATSPVEAAPIFLKAINSSPAYKVDSTTYYLLGTSIINGEYQQLSKEYQEKYAGKDASDEQKAFLERVTKSGERGIDAMARAVALSTKPEQQAFKKQVLEQLTEIYKDLHNNSADGLNELIAAVLSKPLP